MPPRQAKKPPAAPSNSRDLVTTGPKEIQVAKKHHGTRRDEHGNRPSTTRALILRNGKHGAMGTGEVVAKGKISGSEKLELLTEDLMSRYSTALATPFNTDSALKIAEAQFIANLDEIQNLQDPELFPAIMELEVDARRPQEAFNKKNPDPTKNPDFVGRTVATRIHNTYMLASGWRLVGQTMEDIADAIGEDSRIKEKLTKDPYFRNLYLELRDHVDQLVVVEQQQFALLATTAPHWSGYFVKSGYSEKNRLEYIFDWTQGKIVHKSFLDSIVVKLCFPSPTTPKQVLLHLLNEAVDEAPRDAKRFPQALWDAMGDFSMAVQFAEILEAPIRGPEGEAWKREFYGKRPPKPEDFGAWEDAQLCSLKAIEHYSAFKNMIYPLSEASSKAVLQDLWRFVDLNYQKECGKGIDTLWGLSDVKNRKPSWHAITRDSKAKQPSGGYDSDEPPDLVSYNGKKNGKKKPLALTDGNDSDTSMPSLQTVSDSSDDSEVDESASESEESDEESDTDSEYDEDEEDRIREYWREAMDIVTADNDYSNPRSQATEFEQAMSEKKDNPFLKILGGLRGKLVNGRAALRTSDRNEPRHQYTGVQVPASAYKRTPTTAQKPKATTPKKAEVPKGQRATVEEVSDEEEEPSAAKKKKKKPKKKKKKSTAKPDGEGDDAADTAVRSAFEEVQTATAPQPVSAPQKVPTKPQPKPKPRPAQPSVVPPFGSTASLPLYTQPESAQSARTYLQKEGLNNSKAKVKTRSDGPERPSEKKSIFARWAKKHTPEADPEPEPEEKEYHSGDKHGFFSSLSKKTKTYMHQLLNTPDDEYKGLAPLKWDNFLKVMREMGFTYDPSTAGSSVRFDPPNPADPSITFHKPHPDTTIYPVKLREFGKRLKRTYGWSQQDFFKAAAAA
ncbi:hypothetical protein NM688_g1154 [Phlebia brevispora]|uniref:Uncharacterized protein n=1 Tax=Phlebia brevispora TaxID=194682 RepID=A0ACC1TC36_9APHY|nr:hypothetical protein NM688_g1154 [Phlebia brevispora]